MNITEFAKMANFSRVWIYKLIEDGTIVPTIISKICYIDTRKYKHIKKHFTHC